MESVQQFSSRLTNYRPAALVAMWILALLGLVQAELSRAHLGLAPNWFSMQFYFFIPALLWSVFFPLLNKLLTSFPITRNWKNWYIHLALSFIIAFTMKFTALTFDFIIQSKLGSMHGSLINFLNQTRFLLLSSFTENIIIYWALLIFIFFNIKPKGAKEKLESAYPQSLEIKIEEGVAIKIPRTEIIYIEAFGNYLKVHTQEKIFCIRGTIKSISESLHPNQFLRVHRSFIVNRFFIKSVKSVGQGNFHLELNDNKTIRTGRQYKEYVRLLLPKFAVYS